MWSKIKRIDALGALCLTAGTTFLLVGLNVGGNIRPWSDTLVWSSITCGLTLIVLFTLVEGLVAKEPASRPSVHTTSSANWYIIDNANFIVDRPNANGRKLILLVHVRAGF